MSNPVSTIRCDQHWPHVECSSAQLSCSTCDTDQSWHHTLTNIVNISEYGEYDGGAVEPDNSDYDNNYGQAVDYNYNDNFYDSYREEET